MVELSFQRNCGAVADVKELQYIIALLQTTAGAATKEAAKSAAAKESNNNDKDNHKSSWLSSFSQKNDHIPENTHNNSTICTLDIKRLILSRYGISLSQQDVIRIAQDFSGGYDYGFLSHEIDHHHSKSTHKERIYRFLHRNKNQSNNHDSDRQHRFPFFGSGTKKEVDGSHNRYRLISKQPNQDNAKNHDEDRNQRSHDDIEDDQYRENSQRIEKEIDDTLRNNDVLVSDSNHIDDKVQQYPPEASPPEHLNERTTTDQSKEQDRDANDDFERYLDMVEVLSLILIPTIARYTQEWKNGTRPPPNVASKSFMDRLRFWHANYQYQENYVPYSLPLEFFQHDIRELILFQYDNGNRDPNGKTDIGDSLTTTAKTPTIPTVTKDFVRALLNQLGEYEHANNEQLINEMVQVAYSQSGTFDEEAMINAISSDLEDFPTNLDKSPNDHMDNYFSLTTFFEDVYQVSNPQHVTQLRHDYDDGNETAEYSKSRKMLIPTDENTKNDNEIIDCFNGNSNSENNHSVIRDDQVKAHRDDEDDGDKKPVQSPLQYEWFNIDLIIDSHGSLAIVVMIWIFYMLCISIYGALILSLSSGKTCPSNESQFTCIIGSTVLSWLGLALFLSVFGVLFITPLSYGNSAKCTNPSRQLFASIVAVAYAFTPYLVMYLYDQHHNTENDKSDTSKKIDNPWFNAGQTLVLIVGFVLAGYLCMRSMLNILCTCVGNKRWIHWLNLASLSSNTIAETRIKLASLYKAKSILQNALELHRANLDKNGIAISSSTPQSFLDSPMRNYVKYGERVQTYGGFFRVWHSILSGHLFKREGVWINSRLMVMQGGQVLISLFLTIILFKSVALMADNAEVIREELISRDVPQSYVEFIPTPEMIRLSFYPACFVSLAVMVLLIAIYVPSAVATTIKYRCQVMPSHENPFFQMLKQRPDQAYMNMANGIWGLVGSAVLFYIFVGVLVLLFLWPKSQKLMIILLGWCIGLGITIMLKMMLTKTCHGVQFRSFYRVKPASANFTALALEGWYIGIGGSLIIGRISQFLFAAAFWIGRIDVPFLSEDVNLVGYRFDYYPIHFVQDLLVHEAHRHPFIERLSQIFLMKIRYSRFGTKACCVWRQVVVLTLLPWLTKYRVFSKDRLTQAMHMNAVLSDEEQADSANITTELTANISNLGDAAGDFTTDVRHSGATVINDIKHTGTKVTTGISGAVSPISNNINNLGEGVVGVTTGVTDTGAKALKGVANTGTKLTTGISNAVGGRTSA